jgi:SpoU rRNA Methylase family
VTDPQHQLHVVLVNPEIHWNTGNAGRTCLAAGATLHLIEPLGFSLDQRQLRRAGLDYWEHVDLRVWPDWPSFEASLSALGEPHFLSTKAIRPLWQAPLGPSPALPRPLLRHPDADHTRTVAQSVDERRDCCLRNDSPARHRRGVLTHRQCASSAL